MSKEIVHFKKLQRKEKDGKDGDRNDPHPFFIKANVTIGKDTFVNITNFRSIGFNLLISGSSIVGRHKMFFGPSLIFLKHVGVLMLSVDYNKNLIDMVQFDNIIDIQNSVFKRMAIFPIIYGKIDEMFYNFFMKKFINNGSHFENLTINGDSAATKTIFNSILNIYKPCDKDTIYLILDNYPSEFNLKSITLTYVNLLNFIKKINEIHSKMTRIKKMLLELNDVSETLIKQTKTSELMKFRNDVFEINLMNIVITELSKIAFFEIKKQIEEIEGKCAH